MNNFKESLPKSGHVNEVCKEWLVREDGALAYKLQSQEITDFYKGNRFRNAVVREDFPTALHEQIKETEEAAKQAEDYRRRLMEQEEHDKRVAKEIAQKLERDLREQQERDMLQSELIAQQMQEIYVNLPPVPPPASRDKSSRPPPRPAKASTLQQQQSHNHSPFNQASSNQQLLHQQHQLQAFSNTDNYVGLSLAQCIVNQPQQSPSAKYKTSLASPQPQTSMTSSYSSGSNGSASGSQYVVVSDEAAGSQEPTTSAAARQHNGHTPTSPIILTNEHFINGHGHTHAQANGRHHHHQHQHQHSSSTVSSTSSSTKSSASGASTSAAAARRNVFDFHNLTPTSMHNPSIQTSPPPKHYTSLHSTQPHTPSTPNTNTQTTDIDELIEYSDVADSIRRYDINQSSTQSSDALDSSLSPSQSSPAHSSSSRNRSASHENLLRHDLKFQKLSPEKYDQLVGNGGTGEALMQQHADDIELYVDPCDYASLQEIGLPMEEIKEMSKKLKQEQKDELLARRLQQMEAKDGLTQEERDRLLAIEAQDKELAKMLQEREKAKIKRAKEKARQRKNQQKEAAGSNTYCGSGSSPNSGGLHCGPLLALPQDCLSACNPHAKHYVDTAAVVTQHQHHQQQQQYVNEADDPLDMEAYSNPIDVIQQQQNQQQQQQHSLQRPSNGLLTNGSLTRDKPPLNRLQTSRSVNDDDIYTLPVDNCRNGTSTAGHNGRPTSLQVVGDSTMLMNGSQHNSMTRSENYGFDVAGNEALNGHELSSRLSNYSQKPSQTFDQNSSPTPPYMPIQGSRRLHAGEDRKKKSKDSKCTHQ